MNRFLYVAFGVVVVFGLAGAIGVVAALVGAGVVPQEHQGAFGAGMGFGAFLVSLGVGLFHHTNWVLDRADRDAWPFDAE